MLVHLGEGYFVNLNCIVAIYPQLEEGTEEFTTLGVAFSDGRNMNIPYYFKDNIIKQIDAHNRAETNLL